MPPRLMNPLAARNSSEMPRTLYRNPKRRPLRFNVACHSGALSVPGGIRSGEIGERIAKIFGPEDSPERKAYDLQRLVSELAPEKLPDILIQCGSGDFFLNANRAFVAELSKLKTPYEYRESPGGHDFAYWKRNVRQSLVHQLEALKRSSAGAVVAAASSSDKKAEKEPEPPYIAAAVVGYTLWLLPMLVALAALRVPDRGTGGARVPILRGLGVMRRNGPFLRLLGAFTIAGLGPVLQGAMFPYFMQNVVRESRQELLLLGGRQLDQAIEGNRQPRSNRTGGRLGLEPPARRTRIRAVAALEHAIHRRQRRAGERGRALGLELRRVGIGIDGLRLPARDPERGLDQLAHERHGLGEVVIARP